MAMVVISVRLEEELVEKMRALGAAPEVDLTVSELVRRCVRVQFCGEPITCANVRKRTTGSAKRSAGGGR